MTMTLDVTPTRTPAETGQGPNADVVDTIRAHHAQLAAQLQERTAAVLHAAQHGDCAAPRTRLHEWYRSELIPHAVAEERTLYNAAEQLESTALLVQGMLAEHQALVGLIADLARAEAPFDIALAAASAESLFTVHLAKENDLLLPALAASGVDLGALLDGMHELLGSSGAAGPASEELDVRTLPHGRRHEIVFARLDALATGEALVIVNDHDPKPLRYQTEALWPERFAWSYQQAGPYTWRIAITRVH
jgi:uncharacterized protein (DUF2249 family)